MMPVLSLKIINEQGTILAENSDQDEVMLVYKEEYNPGDKIILTTTEKDIHLMVQLDDAMSSSFVYITKNEVIYRIPFGEKKISYSPKSFYGNMHLLSARLATKEEIGNYKNLALNVFDQHGDTGCYPHATANVETRDESVFAARNAIDGVRENRDHGKWPYQSWGINRQDDAELKLEFGRSVKINKIVLYTRADFPHDNWWEEVDLTFSDGTNIKWQLEKSYKPHILNIEEKEVEWLLLNNLIKADDPSPFPALTQIEVYGVDAN
jgi:hypothetical protein